MVIAPSTSSRHLYHAPRPQAFFKRSKCSFGDTSVAYLGHVVLGHGVAMDASKVQAVVDWPRPRFIRALHGFLGLAGYYRKFISEFRAVVAALTRLLKKDRFMWSSEAEDAFSRLKQALTTVPVLALLDFNCPFVVGCDALGTEFVVVLHQDKGLIAYFSCSFALCHQALPAYEQELIGLLQAVRHWRPYLC